MHGYTTSDVQLFRWTKRLVIKVYDRTYTLRLKRGRWELAANRRSMWVRSEKDGDQITISVRPFVSEFVPHTGYHEQSGSVPIDSGFKAVVLFIESTARLTFGTQRRRLVVRGPQELRIKKRLRAVTVTLNVY